ncbi:MAG: hypothetical protein IKK74_08765 [Clostridia bacterium]|nr:hypothetical protein [Clostridia bacterium]
MNGVIDFKIWTRLAPDEDFRLPKISDCTFELIENREAAIDEIPAEILLSVDGIRHLVHARLSDYEFESSEQYARKFAIKLAGSLDGAVEETGKPIAFCTEKLLPPQITEFTPMLTLSVWFSCEKRFEDLYEDIVSLLERELPFALPSKYGKEMPPEQVYGDRNAFIEFLKDTPTPIWYAQKPVTHVHINDANRAEAKRAGLRTNRISIRMPDALYEIEEWRFALRRLLKSLTLTVGGFFGQICRGESGVVSWWWQGVPLELGVACTFCEPYYSLIPDCAEKGEKIADGVAYFEEPYGPYVPTELVSMPKKKLFGKDRRYPDDFSAAVNNPIKE